MALEVQGLVNPLTSFGSTEHSDHSPYQGLGFREWLDLGVQVAAVL